MTQPVHLRLMTPADFEFAGTLRALAGWNQTPADWERFLAHEPKGCFVAEWNGSPAGTATTTSYGADVAWIGMVLVHPDSRRHGIGKALLHRCIDYLQQCQVRSIKLDATPLGKKLYDTLGFRDEWLLTRWETKGLLNPPSPIARETRPWRNDDSPAVEEMDARAFGVSRQKMLALTARQSHGRLHVAADGSIDGYGLLRPGMRASYLGPVVATTLGAGASVLHALLAQLPDQPVFWDIPDPNTAAAELARELGFTPQRQLMRMFLGENHCPGIPQQQFAIGAPEIG